MKLRPGAFACHRVSIEACCWRIRLLCTNACRLAVETPQTCTDGVDTVLASLKLLLQRLGSFKVLLGQQLPILCTLQLVLLHLLLLKALLKALFKCLQGVSVEGSATDLHEMSRCTHAASRVISCTECDMRG
jgi:hypothetical protein